MNARAMTSLTVTTCREQRIKNLKVSSRTRFAGMYVDASLGLEALGILSLLQVPPTRELGENTQGVSTIFKYMRVCVSTLV